jgi:hypothetical protein
MIHVNAVLYLNGMKKKVFSKCEGSAEPQIMDFFHRIPLLFRLSLLL